jgi:hypothetical protein
MTVSCPRITKASRLNMTILSAESAREDSAIRAGVTDGPHDRGDAGFGGSARIRVPPSLFASPVPGLLISAINPVAVVFAFLHGSLLN